MKTPPDHSAGVRSIGKAFATTSQKFSPAAALDNNSQQLKKHKLRIRHTRFGGRSSCLAEAWFDPNDETISVIFDKDGVEADYPCTVDDWKALKDAESVGEEFNFNIKI